MVYNTLLNALQAHCLACHCPIQSASGIFALCQDCANSLPDINPCCQHCADATAVPMQDCGQCLKTPPFFDGVIACARYNSDLQSLIMQLKFQHDKAINRLFADLLYQHSKPLLPLFDVIIPVPMHWRHALWRGNNHSALLAKALAKRCHLPMSTELIRKYQHTPLQRGLDGKQRRRNLRQAFRASSKAQGQRIAIVDDVMTTGSTANEMAKTLKKAGATAVYLLVIAKA